MSVAFQHFDTRLNQWIHTDGDDKNPQSILTENLDNTLLKFYFSDQKFSFGHIDEHSKPEDLRNHPNRHTLLLSSKTRLLYGTPECLEVIEKLCPDRKDRGAYGSIFLGACKNSIHEELNILIVDDSTKAQGENGGIIDKKVAFKLVGDCYGQISPQLYDKLTKREEQTDKSYHVIQHRFGWKEGDGEDTKYRFGKGTLRPYNLAEIKYADFNNKPKIDLILPLSSFKGTDKDRPDGPSKPQIQPGLYKQKIWLGEKSQSERGKTAISQLLASFPQGIKDFAEELETQAQKLADNQDDPRKLAQLYCEKYEKRKAFTESQKESFSQEINLAVADGSLLTQLESLAQNENNEELEVDANNDEELDKSQQNDLLMYKIIKADLMGGHNQLLETEKVRKELSKFVQGEWRDIALGRTLTFDRAMIIPSKELKNGEICVPWMNEGEKVLNFRSPFLNSNGLCVSTNKLVEDSIAPDGTNLKGIIVVNDEDHKRIKARLGENEVAPPETESERQGRDFDGDCIGVALASKYPNFTAEAEYRNQIENAYRPTIKEKKQSFYINGEQPPFEEIAIHMSDSISVGVINNQVTALEALESEIEILKTYGTPEQKSEYLDKVSHHYQKLLAAENYEEPLPIRKEYKSYIKEFVALASSPKTDAIISQAMDVNRQLYRKMIEEACYHNQIAVDLFKSSKKPEMGLIKENNRYLYRQVDYIRNKKSTAVYLNTGIKTEGYSPVELLINQTNKYFQQSQLESRPIVQFQDLFRGVEFTPQQRLSAIAAKHEFDKLFNAAVAIERQRESERGPSAIIQTQQGTKLEITNLVRYKHPLIWKAQTINLKLEVDKRSSKLLAIAQIDNEVGDDGQPQHRKLGTVSPQSVEEYGLKPGMTTSNSKLVELKPELSRGQTKLMFQQAYAMAEAFRSSIPEHERLSAAAAVWNVGAARQDELEDKESNAKSQIHKKTPNFVFAAFGDEIISRLNQLQFSAIRVGTLGNEANSFKDKVWNLDEKYSIEIKASHHPPGHERHASRLLFVQDSDGEYKEFAMLEPRTGQLPIGTKAIANILPGETYTASATISLTGTEPIDFTIREIKKFSHAEKVFHGQEVMLSIGKVPMPNETVKIKLSGKVLGELDADSVKQLQAFNYIKDGNILNLKLTTISESKEQALVLGESPNGNLLKINKISHYDYKGETFHDCECRKVTLEVPSLKTRDAVFLDGEPLGVLHFKKDKEALKQLGVLNFGRLTPVPATLQSNISTTMVVKVDPDTIEYPQTWTKESQVFGQQIVNSEQQAAIERTAPILQKIKERPTLLFASAEDKEIGITRMAVDNHKVGTVTQWLKKKNVAFAYVPPEDVRLETKKGLAVFNLANASIPESVFQSMTKKFSQVIESQTEYQEKVRSLPERPKYLKPPQSIVSTIEPAKVQAGVNTVTSPQTPQSTLHTSTNKPKVAPLVISGKPIPMNYPLILHGEQNPLPVDTCIDAMRGHGRTHTTRAYEPYRQYGFKEGDIAIATGGGKQVAFRVGKQYQISQQMIADPQYQQQWANMEKHSGKALPELFTLKPQVWGLHMEPLGDYVDGKIVPFGQQQNKAVPSQETQPITIEDLRSWWRTADKLGKPEPYKQRIVEIANEFKAGGQLSPQAIEAMQKDSVNRIAQIAHKIMSTLGQKRDDGTTRVQGKIYDVSFNPDQRSWAIAHKNGDVILSVQSGRVEINRLTPFVLQAFENANSQLDKSLEKNKTHIVGIQR
ncbi:hypothetical protein I8752_11185 [Nostocaceae cyanobacterium CENA369]|uniref:Uncharacterized protein n=1 Tax=Dendronalium phyllosphericum CENA369 TaxID=1725256 RepID=A0A8J7I711_9NOST|nr:hypothetical protein [Dendronalium phyllosphericum]MBH8573567.1 hypothetical protein [Dendronalium phyllosphericum CENA369]